MLGSGRYNDNLRWYLSWNISKGKEKNKLALVCVEKRDVQEEGTAYAKVLRISNAQRSVSLMGYFCRSIYLNLLPFPLSFTVQVNTHSGTPRIWILGILFITPQKNSLWMFDFLNQKWPVTFLTSSQMTLMLLSKENHCCKWLGA